MGEAEYFIDENSRRHNIVKEISRGGQGVVYRTSNPEIAVKIEINPSTGEYINNSTCENNKKFIALRLLPIPNDIHITLPLTLINEKTGYVMRLLDDMVSFEKAFDNPDVIPQLSQWINSWKDDNEECAEAFGKYIATGGVKRRISAYLRAAIYLAKLHSVGLVYCDVSPNNMFVSSNLTSSEVWLIDADNINFQKFTKKSGYYTPGYGAPEVIRGEGCTFYSDVYAMLVSLFWQSTNNHPFKGKIVEVIDENYDFADDLEDSTNNENNAYEGKYPWIGNQNDDSNATETPIPYENIFSKEMIKLFDATFSEDGKNIIEIRPSMFEVVDTLRNALNETIKCENCYLEYNYFEKDSCPWCDKDSKPVLIVSSFYYENKDKIISRMVVNIHETTIYIPLHIINADVMSNIDKDAFELVFNNKKCVIKNLSDLDSVLLAEDNITLTGAYEFDIKNFSLIVTENNISKLIEFKVKL